MNRAERRRLAKLEVSPEKVYTLSETQLNTIKATAADDAINKAFKLMLGVPVLVLRDKYGFGRKRLEAFTDHAIEVYVAFEQGLLTLEDIEKTIKSETGVSYIEHTRKRVV